MVDKPPKIVLTECTAMKKVAKTSRKTVTRTAKAPARARVTKKPQEIDLSLGLMLGVVSITLSMLSLVQMNNILSLSALGLGAVAVWLSVRNKHYHVVFSGMAGMLVALVGLMTYLNSLSGY